MADNWRTYLSALESMRAGFGDCYSVKFALNSSDEMLRGGRHRIHNPTSPSTSAYHSRLPLAFTVFTLDSRRPRGLV